MGWGPLRVINEDIVAPGAGFPTHFHKDMEILTYVLAGRLQHRDSMGHGSIISRGEIQIMSAGTGVTHSEFNPEPDQPVHFLQIWILPAQSGLPPRYEQHRLGDAPGLGVWQLMAAPEARSGVAVLQQSVDLWRLRLEAGQETDVLPLRGRSAWMHIVRGSLDLDGLILSSGDGVGFTSPSELTRFEALSAVECLLFDLP